MQIKRVTCFGAFMLLFSIQGCVLSQPKLPQQPIEQLKPYKLSKSAIQEIETALKDQLKDPDSAKFDHIIGGINSHGTVTVCGFVNARNAFGGYAGKTPFLGMFAGQVPDTVFVPIGFDGGQSRAIATMDMCTQHGLLLN